MFCVDWAAAAQVMSLLSQMWKMHKESVRDQGQAGDTRTAMSTIADIDIDALALDFVTNLSLKEAAAL